MKYLAFSRLKCPWNSHGHLRGRLRDSVFRGVPWSVDPQQYGLLIHNSTFHAIMGQNLILEEVRGKADPCVERRSR